MTVPSAGEGMSAAKRTRVAPAKATPVATTSLGEKRSAGEKEKNNSEKEL